MYETRPADRLTRRLHALLDQRPAHSYNCLSLQSSLEDCGNHLNDAEGKSVFTGNVTTSTLHTGSAPTSLIGAHNLSLAMATNGELVEHYPVGSSLTEAHASYIRGNEIDDIYVAWLYESLKPFAWSIRRLKALVPALHSSSTAIKIADLVWAPILDDIIRWVRSIHRPTAVIPVPSTTGLSELLAQRLAFLLTVQASLICGYQTPIERRWRDIQIKYLTNWDSRRRFSLNAFRLRSGLQGLGAAIIVDDVIASGSSLRACASLLRADGIRHIAAVAASADLARWIGSSALLRPERSIVNGRQ